MNAFLATPLALRQRKAEGRTTLLLLLCFILAQADKQVMGLLAVPVQREFLLSDSQLGLLQGVAFAIAFALGGVPIARLLDGGHRIRIASVCVALWSVATFLCGLASSFAMLALCRAATAFSEAGLPPAALSIFSQSEDRRMIARRSSAFMLAPFIGGGLVLMLGGLLFKIFEHNSGLLPAGLDPWRIVFVVLGVPGLLLAAMLALFGFEPARPPATSGRPLPSIAAVLAAIFVQNRVLRYYYPALAAFCGLLAAILGWYPAFLVRELGVSVAVAGGYAGTIYLVAGVTGALTVNLIARVRSVVMIESVLGGQLVALLLLLPVAVGLSLVSGLALSLALYAAYAFLSAAVLATMMLPIQLSLGNVIQARGQAIFALLTSGVAGSAGPLMVGLLGDLTHLSIGKALSMTGGGATAVALLLLLLAWRHARTAGAAV